MSTVILDTITGKSTATTVTIGSTPVVSASANSMTIRGEGSNQTSIQQGLAKTWLRMDGGTIAINDSLNITSITDQATGNYRVAIANDMANANYAATTGAGGASSNNTLMNCATPGDALGAGTIDLDLQYQHTTANDPEIISFALHGDLS